MEHIIQVEKLDHQGRGISHLNNKVIFIPHTNIGDIVKVKIMEEHSRYLIGQTISTIKDSPSKIKPQCPYYYQCGGCDISTMPYPIQLQFKQDKLQNIFERYLNIQRTIPIIPSDSPFAYRNKITLHVQNGVIGLYQPHTQSLIPINECLLVSKSLNQIISLLNNNINLNEVNEIILKEHNQHIQVIISGIIDEQQLISLLKKQVLSIIHNQKTIYGSPYLLTTLNNLTFKISPSSFFQVNTDTTIKLYNQVLKYASPTNQDDIIDLYCGTGTIGLYLSRYCHQVLGIEINEDAINDAKENAKLNHITNAHFVSGPVHQLLTNHNQAHIIIVDPPRKGLDTKTIQTIMTIKPAKLIYVSCNPLTLVRDLKHLQSTYQIKDITGVDLFPQTNHVECVSLLCLKENQKPQ